MSPDRFLQRVLRPGLALMADVLADKRLSSHEAQLLLLAIALQESQCKARWQIGGPARGYWQFEQAGGVRGVLEHETTRGKAKLLCDELDLAADLDAVWRALPYSELLQVVLARLLLWTDKRPLPADGSEELAWEYYLRNWQPGKPSRLRWAGVYPRAQDLCSGGW